MILRDARPGSTPDLPASRRPCPSSKTLQAALAATILAALLGLPACLPAENGEPEPTPEPAQLQPAVPKAEPVSDISYISALVSNLEQDLSKRPEAWGVYVCDLKSGSDGTIGSGKMKAASLIKLFIMAAVYESIEVGSLQQDEELRELLSDMITVSSNQATNELVTILGDGDMAAGMERVNAWCQQNGYTSTEQHRDLQDWRLEPPPGENYTSARDCGRLLAHIYAGECVSVKASGEMLELLLGQTRVSKIPAGVPAGIAIANKTGELPDAEHDAAIVFSPSGAYVLVAMSAAAEIEAGESQFDAASARAQIAVISETTYAFFNPE
jgi:beta-lactamase class A